MKQSALDTPPDQSNDLPLGRLPWKLLLGLLIFGLLSFFLDEPISTVSRAVNLPGDVDQELRFFQQFGQVGSIILLVALVWCLQPPPIRRSLLDFGLAVALTSGIALICKMLTGRARPAFGSPDDFLGPWWNHENLESTWSQNGSLPSSHVAASAVMATWIWIVFPPIRWVAAVLLVLVAVARIRFGSHWPSDILLGCILGITIASLCINRLLGTRLLDLIWRTFVDRKASPAWPDVAAAISRQQAESGRRGGSSAAERR